MLWLWFYREKACEGNRNIMSNCICRPKKKPKSASPIDVMDISGTYAHTRTNTPKCTAYTPVPILSQKWTLIQRMNHTRNGPRSCMCFLWFPFLVYGCRLKSEDGVCICGVRVRVSMTRKKDPYIHKRSLG